MTRKVAGPGRLGSAKAVKKSLKGGGQKGVKTIPTEDSLTVRFLDEPEDWHGYYEHWLKSGPVPCTTDECEGCESDNEEERRKQFRYLANAYVVDDQKVWALKMPKSLVESLMNFHTKYKGTLLDRDYELSRTGSGKNDTKYMAAPDDKHPMKLSRFDSKKFDLDELLSQMVNGDDDDDDDEDETPRRKKSKSSSGPKKSRKKPWDDDEDEDDDPPWDEDEDEDEDDEPVRRPKKSASKKSGSVKRPVKKSAAKRTTVKKTTVKRRR